MLLKINPEQTRHLGHAKPRRDRHIRNWELRDLTRDLGRSLGRNLYPSVVADATGPQTPVSGTTPGTGALSSAVITIGTDQTALTLWFGGAQSITEMQNEHFYIYLKNLTTSTTTKIRCFRWTKHTLPATAGHQYAIDAKAVDDSTDIQINYSLSDGQFISSLAGVTGTATGNANSDEGTPKVWTPQNAHLTLDEAGAEFEFTTPASTRWVFVSESLTGSSWTPPRAVRLNSGEASIYQATYRYIAFCTLDGSAVPVDAVGTIGGASNTFEFPWSEAGDTWTITSSDDGHGGNQGSAGANLEYAIAQAGDEDTIVLNETATYSLTELLGTDATSKSLRIMAGTGITPTIDTWGVQMALDALVVWVFDGIVFDFSAVVTANQAATGMFNVNSGSVYLIRCSLTGQAPTTTVPGGACNTIHIDTTGNFLCFDTSIVSAGRDIISCYDAGYAEVHLGRLSAAGTATGSNNLATCHGGSDIVLYGVAYDTTGDGPAITPDSDAGSDIYLWFCTGTQGTAGTKPLISASNTARVRGVYGCFLELPPLNNAEFFFTLNIVTDHDAASGQPVLYGRDGIRITANQITADAAIAGRGIQLVDGCTVVYNRFSDAFRTVNVSAGLTGTFLIGNNTWLADCIRMFDFGSFALGTMVIENNACPNLSADIVWGTTSATSFTTRNNIFGFVVNAAYKTQNGGTLGTGDLESTTPDMSAAGVASVSDTDGTYNMDNEGSIATLVGLGGVGWDGRAANHRITERSIGGMEPIRNLSTLPYHDCLRVAP